VVDSDRLRAEAEKILSQPKYRVETTTSERFQQWLAELWFRFLEFVDRVAGWVGGPLVLGLILFALVVLVSVLVARNLGARRAREVEARLRREHALAHGADPTELEDAADASAAAGNYADGVRLRFRAGLLRLDEGGRIRFRPGLTSAEIQDLLRSADFELLARRFDEIVYGRQKADADDYLLALEGWARLLGAPVTVGRP
jgi:hypothetical protein